MATSTWIGGGNNKASNPNDWSPAGVPVSGETMFMYSGTMRIDFNLGPNPAFPGLVNGNYPLFVEGDATIDLSKGGSVLAVIDGSDTINVRDNSYLYLQVDTGHSATVNLAANAQWIGGFDVGNDTGNASLIVNGGPRATFINTTFGQGGESGAGGVAADAFVNVNVSGDGGTLLSTAAKSSSANLSA
jgi:hypothetical protein